MITNTKQIFVLLPHGFSHLDLVKGLKIFGQLWPVLFYNFSKNIRTSPNCKLFFSFGMS